MDRLQNNPEAIELMIIKEPEAAVANFDDEGDDAEVEHTSQYAAMSDAVNQYKKMVLEISVLIPKLIQAPNTNAPTTLSCHR